MAHPEAIRKMAHIMFPAAIEVSSTAILISPYIRARNSILQQSYKNSCNSPLRFLSEVIKHSYSSANSVLSSIVLECHLSWDCHLLIQGHIAEGKGKTEKRRGKREQFAGCHFSQLHHLSSRHLLSLLCMRESPRHSSSCSLPPPAICGLSQLVIAVWGRERSIKPRCSRLEVRKSLLPARFNSHLLRTPS
ncbi:hypothetical protein BT69DRAFT_868013 [Atractiella rhizophila]|nr:hypothetical protein BT69DRAFT_868013 [Atractiella rhizophila]